MWTEEINEGRPLRCQALTDPRGDGVGDLVAAVFMLLGGAWQPVRGQRRIACTTATTRKLTMKLPPGATGFDQSATKLRTERCVLADSCPTGSFVLSRATARRLRLPTQPHLDHGDNHSWSSATIMSDMVRTAAYPYRQFGRAKIAADLGLVPTQPLIRKVRFEIRPWGPGPDLARELLPYVDNVSLVDLVSGFEHAAGHDVPGAYAGIVLDHFNFGDLAAYLTGQPDSSYWSAKGVIALLGCDCGDVGCWPLEAQVITAKELVTWRGFSQPHRPKRDYRGFGPFVFRRNQYESAVRKAVAASLPPIPR